MLYKVTGTLIRPLLFQTKVLMFKVIFFFKEKTRGFSFGKKIVSF